MASSYTVTTWKLGDLYKQINENAITVPGFQRSIVWSKKQKDDFIDSLKSGYPFGSLLVYKESGPYILIDGLQRSSTIREYFSKPTEFFAASDASRKLSDFLRVALPQKDNPWESDEIHSYIEKWVKALNINSLDEFLPSKGFKSEGLLAYLVDQSVVEVSREQERVLASQIDPILEELRREADISDCDVPVIIYTKGKEKLPEVFQRLNRGGTQLNKYQIYAAAWAHVKVPIGDPSIRSAIKARFEAYIDKGFTVQDYDSDGFDRETEFSPFEYLYGLGKVLSKNHPLLFSNTADNDEEVDSFGFNLCTYAMGLDVPQMGMLINKLPKLDLQIFQENLLESARQIESRIRPFVAVHANRKKGLTKQEEVPVYHSEFQIVSLIAKYYRMKFVELRKESEIQRFLHNLPYHYLYDIIDDYWRGSGNSKAYDLVQTGSRYEQAIDRKRWELVLETWFENQLLSRKEKDRASIKSSDILFLKYIYSHILTRHEDLSDSAIFEIEHLVPVGRLKVLAHKRGVGLPMSCIANLSLLPQDVNRSKKDQTIYEHLSDDTDMLRDLENRLTFTGRQDFDFIASLSPQAYTSFLRSRFGVLRDKFFQLNNIL